MQARKCIFLGFKQGTKGYLLYSHDIFLSRHVIFYESSFPYNSISHADAPMPDISHDSSPFMFDIPATDMHSPNNPNADQITENNTQPEFDIMPIRRSDRVKRQHAFLKDYHCHSISSPHNPDIFYPLSHVLSYNNISQHHFTFLSAISTETEPKTYKEASKSQQWIQAMNAELDALQQNSTWVLTDLPQGKKPIGCIHHIT